ncbi:class I SAM-dependent methyltransferase [Paenibacillus sediminis]|uniref:2-polyprenyl-3-methyl-5-hydroxy-6-metoxy-1, 4-benzoquinol methylase n=1 Tax=Paenibacillus sediminis TaxID=664909 RepID=A0ABS4H2A2_9BACL|nr:class I SAM-dependent methyltransferase [Paenibacillus sediminis]MBP1936648.1 2-polyprenyl-3-methyl-5-hydroxy-6-metoxy-1,4-benzoquinol methylase [Paenibacillus sediminis]
MSSQLCRLCGEPLKHTFIDLGISPMANSYVKTERQMEYMYPLRTFVCEHCFLVQTEDYETPDHIFTEYAYFSSFSDSWLQHCRTYVNAMMERFGLSTESQVIEIASNDGYLLQYFVEKNVPVLGVEPAANVAQTAIDKGVPTVVDFFGTRLAESLVQQGKRADLLLGNNVLAHVPQLNDFVAGMKMILKPDGIITMEFPHLMKLMENNQFDTIYHEHFSYLSLTTVCKLFEKHEMVIFDVEQLATHGGSLRIYVTHADRRDVQLSHRVSELLDQESQYGLTELSTYERFHHQVVKLKRQLLSFLIEQKNKGKKIVGYGAPAKGNTLINYCGIDRDYIDYTVDRNTYKQGHYLPGSRIPIYDPEHLKQTKPDFLFILPWNIKEEIIEQTQFIREWGGRWILAVPELMVME